MAAGRRNNAEDETPRGLNDAELIREKHDEHYSEREADGLNGDARIAFFE